MYEKCSSLIYNHWKKYLGYSMHFGTFFIAKYVSKSAEFPEYFANDCTNPVFDLWTKANIISLLSDYFTKDNKKTIPSMQCGFSNFHPINLTTAIYIPTKKFTTHFSTTPFCLTSWLRLLKMGEVESASSVHTMQISS